MLPMNPGPRTARALLPAFLAAGLMLSAALAQEMPAAQAQPDAPVATKAAPESAVPMLDLRPAEGLNLADFLWQSRLLVVFADSDLDPAFAEQMDLLQERPADLLTRDVVVITDTEPAAASPIRLALRPRGFSLVFVDKDGVVKLRKPVPWDIREISRSIDKTALRQEELRRGR